MLLQDNVEHEGRIFVLSGCHRDSLIITIYCKSNLFQVHDYKSRKIDAPVKKMSASWKFVSDFAGFMCNINS